MTTNLRDQLQAIYDECGNLTPALVVDAAKDPNHPLHTRLEWDDTKAGDKWRLEQAAHLIRSVKITRIDNTGNPSDLRAFVAVKGAESHQSSYVPTEEALSDPFARQLILRDMEREWKTFKRRFEHMQEFAALILNDIKGKAS